MKKKTVNNILFAIGLATVVVMFLTFDVSFVELWNYLCHAGFWLFPIMGVWLLVYGLNALSWLEVLRSNSETRRSPVSFMRILRLTISGYALNYATPVGGLGGEPYRIIELSRDMGGDRASSSVILYSMMHMFAHFCFWFLSVFLYLALALIGDLPLTVTVVIVLAAILVLCMLLFIAFGLGYKYGLARKVISWIGHIPGLRGWSARFLERRGAQLDKIDEQISAFHSCDKGAFYRSLILEFLSRLVQSTEVMFMLLLFGVNCGGGLEGYMLVYLHSVLIVAFSSLFANLIGFLPMQIGVLEGGFVIAIAALGLTPSLGIFVSLISRVREIVWIVIGLVLMRLPSRKPNL